MTKFFAPALTILACSLPAYALADEAEGPPREKFRQKMLERFDADGDGQLSAEEKEKASAAMKERFQAGGGERKVPPQIMEKFDADGDGKLNDEERAALRAEMQKRFAEGGGPNREEMMKKFDTNQDGKLDEAERATLREKMKERFAEQQRGGEAGRRPQGDRPSPVRVMRLFDANGDGQLDDTEKTSVLKAIDEYNQRRGDGPKRPRGPKPEDKPEAKPE